MKCDVLTESLFLLNGRVAPESVDEYLIKHSIHSIVYIPSVPDNYGESYTALQSLGYEMHCTKCVSSDSEYNKKTMSASVDYVLMNTIMGPGRVIIYRERQDSVAEMFAKQVLRGMTLTPATIQHVFEKGRA